MTATHRHITLGQTIRISDAVYGDVVNIIADCDGTPCACVIKLGETAFLSILIADRPPDRLDS